MPKQIFIKPFPCLPLILISISTRSMDIGILHTHTTVVLLFLLFYFVKTILLVINSNKLLETIRARTKVLDSVLGGLILLTGGYLLFKGGHPATWLIVKFVVVLILIPAGILALRKNNKILAVLVLFGFLYIYRVSETRSLTTKRTDYKSVEVKGDGDVVTAQTIYTAECVRCHGTDGAAQLFGAPNLANSILTQDETELVIANGRKTMPAFKDKFTQAQITVLAAYVEQFKDKTGAGK